MNYRFLVLVFLLFNSVLGAESKEIQLRVMTFNIWYGGEQVSFSETARVIRSVDPDLVGVQEPDGNLRKLAEAVGLSYVDEKRNLLSRYPLFDPDTNERRYPYTRVLVRPGKIVVIANTHLSSTPYGPDLLRDGKSEAEVLKVEQELRIPELQPYLQALTTVIKSSIPVFFAGDFNTPSHLDWANRKSPVQWPVTRALTDAGFQDSYRKIHPDPIAKPGLTYTPGYPHPYKKESEMFERIDMIWYAGNATPLDSKIIGERDNPHVDIAIDPYPSDHRAVLSTFRVKPATAPDMITVDTPSILQGSDFLVRFQTRNMADWSVFIVGRGGDPRKQTVLSAEGPTVISTRPTIKFGSTFLQPGSYDAVLADKDAKEVARYSFHVLSKNAQPELHIENGPLKPGDSIHFSWRNAPGMKNDWVGIYRAEDPNLFTGYISFVYTGARAEGSASLKVPDEPGEYELRFLREDSYVLLARVRFRVTGPGDP